MNPLKDKPLRFGDTEQIAALKRLQAEEERKAEMKKPGIYVVNVAVCGTEDIEVTADNWEDAKDKAIAQYERSGRPEYDCEFVERRDK